jgi:hypothetical protein
LSGETVYCIQNTQWVKRVALGREARIVKKTGLLGAFLMLFATAAGAQPIGPPPAVAAAAAVAAEERADVKAEVSAARAQEKTTAATRQQIQAIRAALRAKLAALHH